MKMKRSLTLLVLLSLVSSSMAFEQSPQDGSNGEAEAARKELEKKALGLLEEALADAQGLKLAENRVRAQVIAAGLLWARDEQAARAAFKSAADGVAALIGGLDPEDQQFFNAAQPVLQMRSELVQTVAQHDPALALDFLRATRLPRLEAFRGQADWLLNQEQMLEANVAALLAAQDPRQALSMAEEALNRGATTGLLGVLSQLKAKDPASASKLAGEIIQKLRSEDLSENGEASSLALQLLRMTRPADPVTQLPSQSAGPVVLSLSRPPDLVFAQSVPIMIPDSLSVDQQARAELIEKVIAAAMKVQPNRGGTYNLFNALQALVPELEKTAPARAAALRQRVEAMQQTFNPQNDLWKPYQELTQKGTLDAILEAAAKAPAEIRDQLYNQAAWKALNEGNDAERARQIIDNISNPQQRAQMRWQLDQQLQTRAAQKGDYSDALQYASRLPTNEGKISALIQIANTAASRGDKQAALQVLAVARGLFDGQPHGQAQFSSWLQLAQAYAPLDPDSSFTMVESAVAQLNELVDAAAVVNGFGQDSFRDGELKSQSGYPWIGLITECAATLSNLAPSDFDRASADAKSFRRADTRALAELMLAQNLLGRLTQQTPARFLNRGRAAGAVFNQR
jgi:uncharacterized protein YjgD (DUF1641 family)